MKNSIVAGSIIAAVLCVMPFATALAKGLGQLNLEKSAIDQNIIEEVVVQGRKPVGSLTSVSVAQARNSLEQVPGGIGFVDVTDYQDSFTQSLGDTLVFTPGVYADTSAQRESRISIRGSGLNATYERRGINVYRDGVPITRASGITEFQEIDPLSVKYIEVFKGGNGIQYGTNALGGAINIVTPTGRNTETGSALRIEAGSFDAMRLNVSTIGQRGSLDYYAAFTKLNSDGFRAHSDVDSGYGFANMGLAINDSVETRLYLTSLSDQFELAGSSKLNDALENPETTIGSAFVPASLSFPGGPGKFSAIDDDWDRNLTVNRIANRTVFAFERWQLEVGVWFANRKLDHAITRFAGIIVQDERETGASLRASNELSVNQGEGDWRWSLGANFNQSDNDAKRFQSVFGQRGEQSAQDQQNAENFSLFGQLAFPLTDDLNVVAGTQYVHARRENEHVPLNALDDEDDSGSLSFNRVSPRLGLLWSFVENNQAYTNISRAYEAPGISDLTSAGVLPFNPLEMQQSTTFEIGTRGQRYHWAWDVSVYRSVIENEFIDFTHGFVTNTVNSVSDTIHQGIEAGVDWSPSFELLQRHQLELHWRHILTVNDFVFDNHPEYGNNELAGVPNINYLSELGLSGRRWNVGVNMRYVADGPYADFSNTTQTGGYTLIGANGMWNVNDSVRLFFSVENAADKQYISNVSTVGHANSRSSIFTPGQGQAVFAGVSLGF